MASNPEKKSLTRYAVISCVLANVAKGMSLRAAIAEVTKLSFETLSGDELVPKKRSIYRWIAAYKRGGLDSLRDESRISKDPSRVLDGEFLSFLRREKTADPAASIPDIIRRAEITGVAPPRRLSRSTVWRATCKMGLPIFAGKAPKRSDQRRFAHRHRMRMVLCDGKHFRAGITRARRVVLFFLDDATRKVLGAKVGTAESSGLFLKGLIKILKRFGTMVVVYLDHGSGFVAGDVATVCARLKIALIHGKVRYPEGHGKIERFNQTALKDLLRSFDGDPSIDPSCEALELRCEHYLMELYNKRPHESLDQMTPNDKWDQDPLELDIPKDFDEIVRHFDIGKNRRVSGDNIVSVGKTNYEMPRGYAGRVVMIYKHLLEGTISVMNEGRMMRLFPVDLAANAASRRTTESKAEDSPTPRVIKTAARLLFDKDHGSIVGPDGSFEDYDDNKNKE